MKTLNAFLIGLASLVLVNLSAHAEPALVSISDDDTTIHVLGTFHVLPPEAKWRTARVDQALAASDAIYMEADVWSDPAQMGSIVQALGLNPPGSPLSSTMSSEEWASVSEFAATMGIPPQGLEPLRPWLAAITLSMQMIAIQGFDPNSGVDVQLFSQANAEGRELRFFETAEEQIRFFSDIPDEIQTSLLVGTVEQAAAVPDQINQLLEAWLAGDLEQMDEIGNLPLATEEPELYAVLITNRNQEWAEELNELMDSPGTYFVAVGTLHLPGEGGVIELMRAEGFEISLN